MPRFAPSLNLARFALSRALDLPTSSTVRFVARCTSAGMVEARLVHLAIGYKINFGILESGLNHDLSKRLPA